MKHISSPTNKHTWRHFGFTCLSLLVICVLNLQISYAQDEDVVINDEEVIAFFESVEDSFINMKINEIMANIHRNFSYTMEYDTDGKKSTLNSGRGKYRQNLGMFFKSKPDIHEYSIEVKSIERVDEVIIAMARVISVVHVNDFLNSCNALSKYTLSYINNRFVIKSVSGKAICTNTKSGDIE